MKHQKLEGGYSILLYQFKNGGSHYEAWPPKPANKIHHMLGKCKTFSDALDKCREHNEKLQSAI